METKINIKDESNDRGYFTIVPNYILNHSTAVAQALYLQLKRLAGEKGVAYPGSRYLRDKLKISQPTLRKEFKYLLEKGWIEYAGEKEIETDGGQQKIKSYRIVDIWQINNKTYQRGEKIDTPCQRGEKIDTQGVKSGGEKIDTKEDPCIKIHSSNKRVAFAPPSLPEVSSYCLERKNKVNPQGWMDFYISKGWMIGKNKMKDWRAAVRTWESREKKETEDSKPVFHNFNKPNKKLEKLS
jgi:hypothetical protein